MKTIAEERDEWKARAEAAESKVTAFETEKTKAVSEAVTPLNAQIATLTQERDAEKTAHAATSANLATITTERDTLKASVAAKDTEIADLKAKDKTASQKALEIAGGQLVKPMQTSTEKSSKDETIADLREQVKVESDPMKRAVLARKINALRDSE